MSVIKLLKVFHFYSFKFQYLYMRSHYFGNQKIITVEDPMQQVGKNQLLSDGRILIFPTLFIFFGESYIFLPKGLFLKTMVVTVY